MLEYFFRPNEDGFIFAPYSGVHFFLLGLMFLGIILILKGGWTQRGHREKISKGLASILLLDQLVLYYWQFSSGYFSLGVSLPLYHCRLAIFFLLVGVFFKGDRLKKIGIFWGILGSTIAMLSPNLYAFSFPHYTNFNFFISHIAMAWLACNLLMEEGLSLRRKDLVEVLVFTDIYNIFLSLLNQALIGVYPRVNYGYMRHLPEGIGMECPLLVHTLFMIGLFDLCLLIIFFLLTHWRGESPEDLPLKKSL